MSRRPLTTALVVIAAILASCAAAAAESTETPPAMLSPELKVQEDPTLLLRRAWADTEWNHFKAGREDLKVEFGGLWSWHLSERLPLSFAVSLKKSFDGGDKDFQFNFTSTYFFRSSKRETLVVR